jgi:hypothetical protein
VARAAGSATEKETSDVLAAPAGAPAVSDTLPPPGTATAGAIKSGAPRSAASSGSGVKTRRCSAAWNVVTRGSVCVDAGATSAQPQ